MKFFLIRFYYHTDLRTDALVEARNEVAALVLALQQGGDTGWVDKPGFRIEISIP